MWKKWFGFNPQTMKIHTEVMAGITSFLAMAYILAVNPAILSATGMDKGALFTTTALAAIIGTLVMALWAKMPFALAPGMGLNAFFAFTVCLQMGNSWQFALTAVFIEGLIFIILTHQATAGHCQCDPRHSATSHRRRHRAVHCFHRADKLPYRRPQRKYPRNHRRSYAR